jgi:hypothetical protein
MGGGQKALKEETKARREGCTRGNNAFIWPLKPDIN